MIRFVIRKLLNKKWMSLALLFGNVLLLSLAVSTPVYTRASIQRTLDLEFRDYITDHNEYPARLRVQTPKIRGDGQEVNEKLLKMDERLMLTGEDLRMPVLLMRTFLTLASKEAESDFPRQEELSNFQISSMSDLMDHIVLSDGAEILQSRNEDGSVNGYLASQAMQRTHLVLGEVLTFDDIILPDGTNLTVRIAGDFVMKDTEDLYWVDSPADITYRTCIFIDESLFRELFLTENSDATVNAEWNLLYDYTNFSAEYVERDADVMVRLTKYMTQSYGFTAFFNFRNRFRDFVNVEKQIRTTYLVLQIPAFLLLVLFIFMVSVRMADNEEAEIAVLSSRGVSRGQILLSYMFQSFLMVLLASACALVLVFPLTKLLLSSNGFLEFIERKDLKLSLDLRALLYGAAGVLAAVAAMVIPALRFAGNSVIAQREKKLSGMRKLSFWHRYFIDVILLGVSLYGLYSFSSREEQLMAEVIAGKALDPLLFLSTAAFMAGAGLFLLRLVPLVQGLIFRLFKNKWSPALFASHRQVQGTRREQGFIMIFLAMTVASGVFYAAAARTIRENDERNIQYLNGADLVVKEVWRDNSVELANRTQKNPALLNSPLTYYEPNYEKYESLPGFRSVTKVYRGEGKINGDGISGKASTIQIMGIEPKLFGETANFDPSLMSVHWYDFLNALSLREDAVILSANYKAFGVDLGDRITLRTSEDNVEEGIQLTVYGFVDYWPGYTSETSEIMEDKSVVKVPQYLAVARLDTMQRAWAVLPYEVWLRSEEGSTESFYQLREERNFSLSYVKDTGADVLTEASGAVKQGTSGIFTVSFITALLLCFTGFLIYWISSVKNRELQFGVLRAMGMRFREILVMLLNEQFFVSLTSIAAGYAAGRLTAWLFMPVIRIAYSSADYPVPLLVVRETGDEVRLFIIIALMVLLGLFIMYRIIRRMRINEALKLGED